MNKEEQRKIQVCLVVNAIVKFNLFPPNDSEEWLTNCCDYEAAVEDLMPDPTDTTFYADRVLNQFCVASAAKTVSDKLLIYDALSVLTGFPIQALAGPILPKMEPNTLTGRCLFTFFNNSEQYTNIPNELVDIIVEWKEFYQFPDPYFFWEENTYNPPWTANKTAASFCMKLMAPENNDIALSCLYGLAITLDRKDILSILDKYEITTNNLPTELQQVYQEFLSSKNTILLMENESTDSVANNTFC